jgi:Pin2-interacting protein X1
MSALAEPRRRQKWTLNPRGNLWANDESKFGQKLMEKMGWEKGKVRKCIDWGSVLWIWISMDLETIARLLCFGE